MVVSVGMDVRLLCLSSYLLQVLTISLGIAHRHRVPGDKRKLSNLPALPSHHLSRQTAHRALPRRPHSQNRPQPPPRHQRRLAAALPHPQDVPTSPRGATSCARRGPLRALEDHIASRGELSGDTSDQGVGDTESAYERHG